MSVEDNAKEWLQICLKSIHDLSRRYFYTVLGDESVPDTLSFLLSVKEADLLEIFKLCRFYVFRRKVFWFQRDIFKAWVGDTFERGTVELYVFRKKPMIKLSLGEHPCRPAEQWKES
jgi:hypothetical protein